MGNRICSFPECGGSLSSHGLCRAHRDQQRAGKSLTPLRREPRPLAERFWEKVDRSGGAEACWPWLAYVMPNGYGQFRVKVGQSEYAHRMAYRLTVGDIPDGFVIDHLCHNAACEDVACAHRRCVNPSHLTPTSHRENLLRGNTSSAAYAARDRCSKGHPYDQANTRVTASGRQCRACDREYQRRKKVRRAS